MIRRDFKPFNTSQATETDAEVIYNSEAYRSVEHKKAPVVMPQPSHLAIKDLAAEDRPREKLIANGVESLTVPELLAILIGGGTTEQTAVEIMRDIMEDCQGKLQNLSKMSMQQLMSYKGIGEARALSIIAAAEIGRRRASETAADLLLFGSGAEVYAYMRPKIQDLYREESWVLLLNNNSRLIRCAHLSSGGISDTSVDVRMLFKEACLANATCFILVHNHPSGSLRPSRLDDELTANVHKASKTMNIRMLDHVIVADGGYYSYAEEGKL